MIVEFYWSKV